jgi:hypothetical protein
LSHMVLKTKSVKQYVATRILLSIMSQKRIPVIDLQTRKWLFAIIAMVC